MIIDNIKFLENKQNNFMLKYFNDISNMANVYEVFNPSFVFLDKIKVSSFRAVLRGDKEKELISYFCIDKGCGIDISNLSKTWSSYLNVPRLIDPKVFSLEGDIYITFNSGHVIGGNDIFVMKIYPNIEPPKKILYDKRQEQERNWSFFNYEDEIYALYWINPLTILRLEKSTENAWYFVDKYKKESRSFSSRMTLGTQLCRFKNKYYFIGHFKKKINNKKLYLGKIFNFDFIEKNIIPYDSFVAHSFDSLFGEKYKSNNNLFSCTYFSGLNTFDDELIAGYGINDLNLGFSSIL